MRMDEYYGGWRVVNAQIWYPSQSIDPAGDVELAPYYYKLAEAARQLPWWTAQDIRAAQNIETQSALNAPIRPREKAYPLILFSPSLGGHTSHYTYYAEALAQAGYVVLGVNHLYESMYVQTEANEIIPAQLSFHDSLKELDIPAQISVDEYRAVKGIRQQVLGSDLLFALDQISDLNTTIFNGQIDLQRIGACGHSIGGAAAISAAYQDARISAVVNLDGTPPSVALENGIKGPFLFIEDLTDYDNHPGYQKLHQRRNTFCEKVEEASYRILITNINHDSFLDTNLHFGESADERMEAQDNLSQISSYIRRFLDHHLGPSGSPFLRPTQSDSLEILVFPDL